MTRQFRISKPEVIGEKTHRIAATFTKDLKAAYLRDLTKNKKSVEPSINKLFFVKKTRED